LKPVTLGRAESAGAKAVTFTREQAETLSKELAARGIDGIALNFIDNSGITRVKAIPTAQLTAAVTSGVGMSPVFDVLLVDDSVTPSEAASAPVGDLRLYPDLSRLVDLAAQPGWAWAPVDRRTRSGEAHSICHRSFASRMVARAEEMKLAALMAFELEWVIGSADDDQFAPATLGPAYGMSRLVDCSDYLRHVLQAFEAEGLEVQQIHPEYATGQFEVSVTHNDPVGAADDSVLARQTVRAVGRRHGFQTSFAPSVIASDVGNGGHVHISLWRGQRNLFAGGHGPYGITTEAEAFMAGILRELPALLVLGAPSVASYLRLVPQHWAGAYQTWGLENREAAVRLVTGTVGHETRSANVEVKCFDLSASPYLVAGGIMAAGLAGVKERLKLPREVTVDPATMTERERSAAGAGRLPISLPAALSAYESSTLLAETLGRALYETIAAVRKAEVTLFANASPEEVACATRWRY
jgi:glutamine synthetase